MSTRSTRRSQVDIAMTPSSPALATVSPTNTSGQRSFPTAQPAFEMVVLGSGGGPFETDCSGYLVKPLRSNWEDGILALEGGSGIGALMRQLSVQSADRLFPDVDFPPTHNTPVLQAAYIFSYLSCYLITHAHLDHAVSLILLSGSIPPRPNIKPPGPLQATTPSSATSTSTSNEACAPTPKRIPVYATRETLDNLAGAYGGGLWPELSAWAAEPDPSQLRRKRKRIEEEQPGVGAKFSPLHISKNYSQLHPGLPISILVFPVAHGNTTKGIYSSTAAFLRYEPSVLESAPASRRASQTKLSTPPDDDEMDDIGPLDGVIGREFLFFGDVESGWRPEGKEHIDKAAGDQAAVFNLAVWEHAAKSFSKGRLAAIFIECSYDSSREADIMFGHVSPPGIFHELRTLASLLPGAPKNKPLAGLKIFITHIKEFLVPHISGLAARDLIRRELHELETQNNLGVEFHLLTPGERVCE